MGLLRLLLALSVLLSHDMQGWFKLIDGDAAVQSFFAISGFYMALVLNETYADLRGFYVNRALRLFPTYWAVVLLTVVVAALAGEQNFIQVAMQSELTWDAKLLVYVSSLFLVGSDVMLFVHPTEAGLAFTPDFWHEPVQLFWFHPIPPAWSLPVEMAFYALAPFLVRNRWRLLFALLAGLVIRVITYKAFGSHDPWRYRFFPAELSVFCAGALAYHFFRAHRARPAAARIGALCLPTLFAVMLAYPYLPAAAHYVPVTALVLASLPFVFARTRERAADRWLGELSYPVYLLHLPVLHAVGGTLATILCTPAGAVLIHTTLARPLERTFKRGAATHAEPASALPALA